MKKIIIVVLFLHAILINAQEKKITTQFSPFLSKTYYNFNFGAVFYPYSNANLKLGYASETLKKNVFSGRFLLGYKLKENLGLQFGVMRPASWFSFTNVNNIGYERSVWLNLWSLSLKRDFPISERMSFYTEIGFGNLARVGFSIGDEVIYGDAQYATLVSGLGLSYRLNEKWDFLVNALYLPKSKKYNQPYTFQTSVGLQYNVKQVPLKQALEHENSNEYFFPKRFIQLGYGSSQFGFGANRFFTMNTKVGKFESVGIPIFWFGDSKAAHTLSLTYQQTAFHSKKLFSLDWGVSFTGFQTIDTNTNVFAVSIFPVVRFYVYRPKNFDFYLNYSIIGPTYISKKNLDGFKTGPHLTYQDFMGMGVFFGKSRKYNFELRIMHYSNGNIFPENDGVAIPVILTFGKTL